jgi:hypothetical protein
MPKAARAHREQLLGPPEALNCHAEALTGLALDPQLVAGAADRPAVRGRDVNRPPHTRGGEAPPRASSWPSPLNTAEPVFDSAQPRGSIPAHPDLMLLKWLQD